MQGVERVEDRRQASGGDTSTEGEPRENLEVYVSVEG